MATTTKKTETAAAAGRAVSKREQARQARARRQRNRWILYTALAVVIAGGLAALVLWAALRPQPGERVRSQGNDHITEAQMGLFTYNTTPPTSGPHLGTLAEWGVHDQPIPNELQVHNLEDGGVLVQYDCPEGCPDLVDRLTGVVGRYAEGVILAPYPGMGTRIALTAWQRIDRLDTFDEARIEQFIAAYRGIDHHVE